MEVIDGGQDNKQERLAEIKIEMHQITDQMFSLAQAGIRVDDDVVIPCSQNGRMELTKVLGQLMDEQDHRFNSEPMPPVQIDTKGTGKTIPYYSNLKREDFYFILLIFCDFTS